MPRLFGTDGIREEVNKNFMVPEMIMKLGQVIKLILPDKENYSVLIGKDTRLSCSMLESAIIAGLVSVGIDVTLLGFMPTSGISILTKSMKADIGIMISASHNKYIYNGIKFFDHNGNKFTEEIEKKIEEYIFDSQERKILAIPEKIGKVKKLDDAETRYIEYVKKIFPKYLNLSKMKIAIDTANGAAYNIARRIFESLGANIITFADEPNGLNINENCGVISPEFLAEIVKTEKCDIGIILDGDADRLIIIDELGNIIDGDQVIGLLSKYFFEEKKLSNNIIVTTIMSNLGLENFLKNLGITMIRTDVGDKNVASIMRKNNSNLGGEQSGHIILYDYVATGDGLIAALKILEIMLKTKKKLSKISKIFVPYSQIKEDVEISSNIIDISSENFKNFLKNLESEYLNQIRIIVRKSGTEPVIRIMIESSGVELSKEIMQKIKLRLFLTS